MILDESSGNVKISKEVLNNIAVKRLSGDEMLSADDVVREINEQGFGEFFFGRLRKDWRDIRDPIMAQGIKNIEDAVRWFWDNALPLERR